MKKSLFLALLFFIALPGVASADINTNCATGEVYRCDAFRCGCFPSTSSADSKPNQSGFTALAPIPGLTDQSSTSVINSDSLASFFNNLYKYLIGLAATIAVIEIIWGGLLISTPDSISKQGEGRDKIRNAIFGLVLVLSPVLVFSIINPSILNLSLKLDPIDLKTPPIVTSGGGAGTGVTPAGCSASLTNGAVGCPTQQAAEEFAASCSNGQGTIYSSASDPKYPYQASCNALGAFQGHRDYTDKTKIPNTYWCYVTMIISGSVAVPTYICGADKNSCDALVMSNAGGGTYAGGCRAAPY